MVSIPLWVVVVTVILCILLGSSMVSAHLERTLKLHDIQMKAWKEISAHHIYIERFQSEVLKLLSEEGKKKC